MKKLLCLSIFFSVSLLLIYPVKGMEYKQPEQQHEQHSLFNVSLFSPQTTVDVHPNVNTKIGSHQFGSPYLPITGLTTDKDIGYPHYKGNTLYLTPLYPPLPPEQQTEFMQKIHLKESENFDDTVVDVDQLDYEHMEQDLHKESKEAGLNPCIAMTGVSTLGLLAAYCIANSCV